MSTTTNYRYMKYVSLCVLSFQTAAHVLVTRYSRAANRDNPYLPSTTVAIVELLKLIICFLVLFCEKGYSLTLTAKAVKSEVIFKPRETFKLIVPALLYVVQNNLLFAALSNLDSATYQVCYQTKILTTAVFSVVLLSKKLRPNQWISLLILTVGVALVQLAKTDSGSPTNKEVGSTFIGMIAVLAAACTSGFSGVYFEKVLKGSSQSLWIRNIQLAGFSVVIALASVFIYDRQAVMADGYFQGYTVSTWIVISLGVMSGLTVAMVVKYADNILKGFAVSISIVISTFVSFYFLNDFDPSVNFFTGAALVISATFLYGLDFKAKSETT